MKELRAAVKARLKETGKGTKAEALRAANFPPSSFERILREGLNGRSPRFHEDKLRELGVLDLIPRS